MSSDPNTSTSRILVVDDDKTSRHLVAAKLKCSGFDVLEADSAPAGREILDQEGCESFDLVISDYWMPGSNGLEFLKSVRLLDSCLSVILITADGEREILANLVQFGGCGFMQKPFSFKKLDADVKEAIRKTKIQRHLKSTESEANTLGENQRLLLKQQLEVSWPGIEFSYSSKSQASGDFVSSIPMSNGRHILLLSDASGHELSSALQSNYFHGLARGMLQKDSKIEDVFNFFNTTLKNEWNVEGMIGHSLAACAICFDSNSRTAQFINAGFPHPMIAGIDGYSKPLGEDVGAPPLGWFDDTFPPSSIQFEPGTIIAWTDGLEDLAEHQQVDPLALADRLMDTTQSNKSLLTNSFDDVVVVRALTPGTPAEPAAMIPILSQRYPGREIENIDAIQIFCEKSIRYSVPKMDPAQISDALVCLREALINALKHGCQGRDDLSARLQIARSPNKSKLTIQIIDEGTGHTFDWESHAANAAENLIAEHRGLLMIQTIPNKTEVLRDGAHVIMEFEETNSLN